jgi:ribosomal protein S3AE
LKTKDSTKSRRKLGSQVTRIASGEIDTEHKKKKLLEAYAEELLRKYPEWENLQVSVVAGAGFEPAAFRL